jgi:hypothetical protein
MRYTLHLFATNEFFWTQSHGEEFLERTRNRVIREGRLTPSEIERGMHCAAAVLSGQLPDNCDQDHFWGLCWIAETVLERIPLESLVGVNSISAIEDTGILPTLWHSKPPFPVPVNSSNFPRVGFLPSTEMVQSRTVIKNLPSAMTQYGASVRREFCEVLESLEEDSLGLLAILI